MGQLDVIGNAYEFLIKNFASTSGKKAGEFYTPPEVSSLMARLMAHPKEGDEICDPTCGSGSLLMKCGRLIREKTGSRSRALWARGHRQHLGPGQDEHVPAWRR